MAIKKGDILDERKRFPHSCGLVVKCTGGGEGFKKIFCCGHGADRRGSCAGDHVVEGPETEPAAGAMLESRRQFPDSCGLRLMVMDGGPGLQGSIAVAISAHSPAPCMG